MRICILGPKSCPPMIGGIETFAHELGKRLVANGADVTIIVPRAPGLRNEDHIDGIRVLRVRAIRNRFALKTSMIPHEILETARMRPDIFHANDIPSGVVGSLDLTWRDCVLTVHGIGLSHSEWPTPFRQGGRVLQRIAVHGARVVTATDDRTASMLNGSIHDMRVIPPGVDTARFSPGMHRRPERFSHDRINILHVGRLTKVKGTDLIVDSLELLPKDIIDTISIKVIGGGPLTPLVEGAAAAFPSIEWLGEIPHSRIAPYIAHADMLLMPSRSEGLPISMLEAMSCCVPVIGTAVGGIDTYFDDRHLTKIAEPTAEAVATSIEEGIADRAILALRAARAKQLVDVKFSWDAVSSQYMRLYEEILS